MCVVAQPRRSTRDTEDLDEEKSIALFLDELDTLRAHNKKLQAFQKILLAVTEALETLQNKSCIHRRRPFATACLSD
ncbi:unnamed protein product [Caretta caretta]